MKFYFNDKEYEVSFGRVTANKVIKFEQELENMIIHDASKAFMEFTRKYNLNPNQLKEQFTKGDLSGIPDEGVKELIEMQNVRLTIDEVKSNLLCYCKIAQIIGHIVNHDDDFKAAFTAPLTDSINEFWNEQDINEVESFVNSFRGNSKR